jgi:hypothetical protein
MSYAMARAEFDKIDAFDGRDVDIRRRTRAAQIALARAHVWRWPGCSDLEHVGCLSEEVGELVEAPPATLRLELEDVLICAAMLATSHRLDFDPMVDYGKRIGRAGPRWCHMIADTVEELHAMAIAIGLRVSWFQNAGSHPHYDIGSEQVRERAVAEGALDCDRRTFVGHMQRIRAGGRRSLR